MDPERRKELARYGAPAAFLLAATIAILLIKSGLNGSSVSEPVTTAAALPTAPTTTTAATTRITLTTAPLSTTSATTTAATTSTTAGQTYSVESGDTLGGIAVKFGTTVDELLRLNPGVDPTSLHVGQQIRVS